MSITHITLLFALLILTSPSFASDMTVSKDKRFEREELEAAPVIVDDLAGALYRTKDVETDPLLYSPKLDRMVNPDCPYEDMEGSIRSQIGYSCNGSEFLNNSKQ